MLSHRCAGPVTSAPRSSPPSRSRRRTPSSGQLHRWARRDARWGSAGAPHRAVSGAAGADVAARAGLAVLAKCVAHKAGYIERVFPPDLVGPFITNIRLAIWDAAARILEWSHSERDARQLRLQAAMHHMLCVIFYIICLDLALHPDPYAFLASWWGAAHARAGAVPPSQIVRAAAGDHSPAGTVVSAAFAACAARDSAIPPSLEGLADRLDSLQ